MKYIKTFESFLNEQTLNEIGNSKPLPWEKAGEKDNETFYKFYSATDSYLVTIEATTKTNIDVSFTANGYTARITNSGNQFATLATVLSILKEHLQNNHNIKSFSFMPEKNTGPEDNRREDIYVYAIKREFPNAKIASKKTGNSEMEYRKIKVTL